MERYQRQLILKEIGTVGQEKLKEAKVLVIGAGGLGSPVLYYLTAVGVGTIGIADNDIVGLSNLNRQFLHFTEDRGRKKTNSAAEKLSSFNPEVQLIEHDIRLEQDNISLLIKEYDIVVDATDNFRTRFLINDCCYSLNKPLIEGAVKGFEGILLTIFPKVTPCYRCLYQAEPEQEGEAPIPFGIIGATAGVIGSLQAMEVIKIVTGAGEPMKGLLTFDGLSGSFRTINWTRRKECPLCGEEGLGSLGKNSRS